MRSLFLTIISILGFVVLGVLVGIVSHFGEWHVAGFYTLIGMFLCTSAKRCLVAVIQQSLAMTVHMHLAIVCLTILSLFATSHLKAAQLPDAPPWSPRVQQVLEITKPLQFDRGDRLPLYLWPAMNPGELNERSAEELVRQLDLRGIGLISSWSPKNRETTLVR